MAKKKTEQKIKEEYLELHKDSTQEAIESIQKETITNEILLLSLQGKTTYQIANLLELPPGVVSAKLMQAAKGLKEQNRELASLQRQLSAGRMDYWIGLIHDRVDAMLQQPLNTRTPYYKQKQVYQKEIETICKAADSVAKLAERKAKLLGLDAPSDIKIQLGIEENISNLLDIAQSKLPEESYNILLEAVRDFQNNNQEELEEVKLLK